MKTLKPVVLVAFAFVLSIGFVAGCGESGDGSPVGPSPSPVAGAASGAPRAPAVRPASFSPGGADVDTVAPGDDRYGPNAYDFFATWDGSALNVALVEDAMARMRRASQPHRMRAIEVFRCASEPRHVLQTCGEPLFSGTLQLAGRLELPTIDLAACASHEWLVVTAAELSDDRYDGWRNAPCPRPNGVVVGSDGSGPGWDRSEHGPPPRDFPPEPGPEPPVVPGNKEPEIENPGDKSYQQGAVIEAFRIEVTDEDDDDVTVEVSGLPRGLTWSSSSRMVSGRVEADAPERTYTVTVTANDGTNDPVTATFTITIGTAPPGNRAPEFKNLRDRWYAQGTLIEPFSIEVTDADGDAVTVDVRGLPRGLTWSSSSRMVSGRVDTDLDGRTSRVYPVTVTADDGKESVRATFALTIAELDDPPPGTNSPPRIEQLRDWSLRQGEDVGARFIVAFDAERNRGEGDLTVSMSGLPQGLTFGTNGVARTGEQQYVTGTVAANATVGRYPVTVTADDGVNRPVTGKFYITIRPATGGGTTNGGNAEPVIRGLRNYSFPRGGRVMFEFEVYDPDREPVTVTVSGLPDGLDYVGGQQRVHVTGTVAASASLESHTVTVTADDRKVDRPVRATFTITVYDRGTSGRTAPPRITHPGNQIYVRGRAIRPLSIEVSGDNVRVSLYGLPSDLEFSESRRVVTGTPNAAARSYTVTVEARQGDEVPYLVRTREFTITITDPSVVVARTWPDIAGTYTGTWRRSATGPVLFGASEGNLTVVLYTQPAGEPSLGVLRMRDARVRARASFVPGSEEDYNGTLECSTFPGATDYCDFSWRSTGGVGDLGSERTVRIRFYNNSYGTSTSFTRITSGQGRPGTQNTEDRVESTNLQRQRR